MKKGRHYNTSGGRGQEIIHGDLRYSARRNFQGCCGILGGCGGTVGAVLPLLRIREAGKKAKGAVRKDRPCVLPSVCLSVRPCPRDWEVGAVKHQIQPVGNAAVHDLGNVYA